MLSTVSHVRNDEVHIKGYIKQNYLNAKRLIHITGLPIQGWKIKRIKGRDLLKENQGRGPASLKDLQGSVGAGTSKKIKGRHLR